MKSKLAAVLLTLFATHAAQAAILTNGDFEQGDSGWTMSGNVDVVAHSGSGFYKGGGSVAQNGTGALAFNSDSTLGTGRAWQSFATTAGTSYKLTFAYGTTSFLPQALGWGVFGSSSLFALAGGVVADTNWSGLLDTYRFDFVADSTTTTLLFADFITNFTLGTDGLLDNVRVTANALPAAVPEPGSLALLGLGILGLGACRRRKAA